MHHMNPSNNIIFIALFLALVIGCKNGKSNNEEVAPESKVSTTFQPQLVLEINKAADSLIIDGELLESAWQEAEEIQLRNNVNGKEVTDKDYSTKVKCCYDDNNLYIAFVNNDQNIFTSYTKKDEFLWQDEVVEVFIDGDPIASTYLELEVSPTNVVFDSYITDTANIDLIETPKFEIEGLQTAVQVNGTVNDSSDVDQGWTTEILIPLTAITQKRSDGKTHLDKYRINFYRINRDSQGPNYYAWSPTFQRFHSPSSFGEISLNR